MASRGRSTVQFAARFAAPVVERLQARARRVRRSQRELAERYIDEGMRMDDHPGIVFREGPMGRRAGLAAGPDVWEIVAALKQLPTRGPAAVRELAELLELGEGLIQTGLSYYGEFKDEVDELIRRNEEQAERAEAAWREQQTALQ
ncbi:MAG: hypothetical protein WD844_08485 [Thermoleophilaceae bacterium]